MYKVVLLRHGESLWNKETRMSEQTPEDQAPTPDEANVLDTLQQENEQLKAKIEELVSSQQALEGQQTQLREAETANDQLRQRYANVALKQALSDAATTLGLSREAADV